MSHHVRYGRPLLHQSWNKITACCCGILRFDACVYTVKITLAHSCTIISSLAAFVASGMRLLPSFISFRMRITPFSSAGAILAGPMVRHMTHTHYKADAPSFDFSSSFPSMNSLSPSCSAAARDETALLKTFSTPLARNERFRELYMNFQAFFIKYSTDLDLNTSRILRWHCQANSATPLTRTSLGSVRRSLPAIFFLRSCNNYFLRNFSGSLPNRNILGASSHKAENTVRINSNVHTAPQPLPPLPPCPHSDAIALSGEVLPSRIKPSVEIPVCLLHGLLGSRKNLRTLGSLLISQRIVSLDLRNHGQSEWRDSMTVNELARDLLHTLSVRADVFRTRPGLASACHSVHTAASFTMNRPSCKADNPVDVVLVGHSLGGLTAMKAAVLASKQLNCAGCSSASPVRIAGLVVLDIAPVDYFAPDEQQRMQQHHIKHGTLSAAEIVQRLARIPIHSFENKKHLETALRSSKPPLPPDVVAWLMTAVREKSESPLDCHARKNGTAASSASSGRADASNGAQPPVSWSSRSCTTRFPKLSWEMNIEAISHMMDMKQLKWSYPSYSSAASACGHVEKRGESDSRVELPNLISKDDVDIQNANEGLSNNCWHTHLHEKFEGLTVFLRGSHSPYINVERHWPKIMRIFPNAQLRVIDPAGHWVHAEQPQQTAAVINEVLRHIAGT